MQLSKLLASLWLLVSLSSCASYQVSDFQVDVTLVSGDCYIFNVVSGKEHRLKADSEECQIRKRRSVRITSENYLILRKDIFKNCQFNKCKELVGVLDELFLAIDMGLRLNGGQ